MEFNSNVFKFKYNGEDCEIREPSSMEHVDFIKKHEKAKDDNEKSLKLMQDFYISLGLSKKACMEMPLRVLGEIGKMLGGEEKK